MHVGLSWRSAWRVLGWASDTGGVAHTETGTETGTVTPDAGGASPVDSDTDTGEAPVATVAGSCYMIVGETTLCIEYDDPDMTTDEARASCQISEYSHNRCDRNGCIASCHAEPTPEEYGFSIYFYEVEEGFGCVKTCCVDTGSTSCE
jgi:hypothetical protein